MLFFLVVVGFLGLFIGLFLKLWVQGVVAALLGLWVYDARDQEIGQMIPIMFLMVYLVGLALGDLMYIITHWATINDMLYNSALTGFLSNFVSW